jgi:hypothetical protein
MGAWGTGNFENDTATEWVGALRETGDAGVVEQALKAVTDPESADQLAAGQGSEALAAAEVVAISMGHPPPVDPPDQELVDDLRTWAIDHPQVGVLAPIARRAVDRVAQPGSELREQWFEDDDDAQAWTKVLDDLRARLVG